MTTPVVRLGVAASATAALIATYRLLVVSPSGQEVDHDAMLRLGALTGHDVPTFGLLGQIQIPVLFGAAATVAAVCLARGSIRLFLNSFLVIVGVTVAALVLQAGLDRPTAGIGALNSFPSKTVAVFAAVGIALCAVVPRRVLPVVCPIVVAVLAAVSVGVVCLLWHRPSDVIGGLLLAIAVAALVECVLPVWTRADRGYLARRVQDLRQLA